MLIAAAILLACGAPQPPQGELLNIQDDQHEIANPSKLHATATGMGCGTTKEEALTSARRVAQFNLRSLSGQARYLVAFELLNERPNSDGICVEVAARAMP